MIEKKDLAALRYMKEGRILAQQLLKQKPDEYDALLAVGVENYLTGIKPAPVRWMLSLGGIDPDKEQGIRELEQTAAHGNLLKPFASCCWRWPRCATRTIRKDVVCCRNWRLPIPAILSTATTFQNAKELPGH